MPTAVAQAASDPASQEAAADAEVRAWLPRRAAILDELTRAPDVRTRAAAWRLDATFAGLPAQMFQKACEEQAAASGVAFAGMCEGIGDRAVRGERGLAALVRLALSERDPLIYGWAVGACHHHEATSGGPCQLVNPDEWARLEPDNGLAWQQVAEAATDRGDRAALDAAVRRIAQAGRFDGGWGRLGATLSSGRPDASVYERAQLSTEAIGVEAAAPAGSMVRWCRPPLDANRRQVCDELAQTLLDKGVTLMDHMLAMATARYAGWPTERIKSLEQQRDAYQAVLAEQSRYEFTGCKGLRTFVDYVRNIEREGEIGYARRLLAERGVPIEEVARAHRARIEASRAAVTSAHATSGASAAPPPR